MALLDPYNLTATQIKKIQELFLLQIMENPQFLDASMIRHAGEKLHQTVTDYFSRQQSNEDWKMAEEYDRFASFVERYVVARASTFRSGYETEDGWKALKDAEVIFDRIKQQTAVRNATDQAVTQAHPNPATPGGAVGISAGSIGRAFSFGRSGAVVKKV